MQEIAALKKHIINYSKTREVYVANRKGRVQQKILGGADHHALQGGEGGF